MYTGIPPNKVLLEAEHFSAIEDTRINKLLQYVFSKKLRRKKNPLKV